jgi:gliding motility-associated-like protein
LIFAGLNPNSYNVTVQNTSTGCVSLPAVGVVPTTPPVSPIPTAPLQPEYCQGAASPDPYVAFGTGTLLWYTTQTGGTSSSVAPVPKTAVLGEQTYYVSNTNPNACESDRVAVTVKINELPVVSAGPDRRINLGESVVLQGVALGNSPEILWSPSASLTDPRVVRPTAKPDKNTVYTIQVITADGCFGKDDVTVVVLEPIDIPNAFSPNGDGVNDLWVIAKLEQYPNCVVEVFNRYGSKVLERKGYSSSNAWDGKRNGTPLPVGTYYYILRLGDGTKPRNGVISIIR